MFTKGKWKAEGNRVVVRGSGTIAKCPSPTTEDGVMDFIANTHLIAAAPRMYKALEGMVEWARLSDSGDTGEWADCNDPAIITAREALSKARGE